MTLFNAEAEFDRWFAESVGAPTAVQRAGWPVIRAGSNALLIAATGQGKSLAAWRPLVERIVEPIIDEPMIDVGSRGFGQGVRALHIAPLKALSRDMTANLEPLLDFAGRLRGRSVEMALRCGDTPPSERARQRRRPPDILSTTPESLFVLLGSAGGRRLLRTVGAVVVDELHALVGSKRGAHLALSLARLERLTGCGVQRIGLSATAAPAEALGAFLCGGAACEIVAPESAQAVELCLELPQMPLGAFPNTLHWQQIHARIVALAGSGGSLLVFCQTRAQVERTAAALDELLGEAGMPGRVGAHHGSLDTAHREGIEARFKAGELRVLVSSASLELGLDLGYVDRVCQIGVPGSVNLVRQRAGRSNHRPGGRPRMHLFALTLNQRLEAAALDDALAAGHIESSRTARAPLDVLAQHLAAMLAAGEDGAARMRETARGAWPYRDLGGQTLDSLLAMLADRIEHMPAEQTGAMLVRDDNGGFRAAAGTDRLVLTNAGVIPEFFEYEVVRVDTGDRVGTLDEEFAFESSPGQIVQLGRRSWRVLRVRTGEVQVEPAEAEPSELPFWFGEGPGRTPEMARAMLGAIAGNRAGDPDPQAAAMLDHSRRVLGALPAPDRLVIERFADPGGDRHVVVHTFAGAGINRAWGLALRKRFCRQFNFELQAAATDDGILISLGVTSRFELADLAGFVRSSNVADVLTQALLDTPLFVTRFRWCANNALVLLKNDRSGRVHPQRQRSQAENLIACVFPDQLACLENLGGPREVPDHPLVQQALADCLHDYMDLDGLKGLLGRIENGTLAIHAVDTAEPSPLAQALIHAPRHSYLDEAAAEERRTRSFERFRTRAAPKRSDRPTDRTIVKPPAPVSGPLRCEGPEGVRPCPDALERLLLDCGFLTAGEGEAGVGLARPAPAGGWSRHFATLVREKRAVAVSAGAKTRNLWIATDRLGWVMELAPALEFKPWLSPSLIREPPGGPEIILQWLVDGRARIDGSEAERVVARMLGLKSVAA